MKKQFLLGAALMAATVSIQAQKPMTAPAGGKAISDELIGIFFEDISSAADGGLYAELLQNGSFEFNPAERDGWGAGTAWKQIRPGHSLGTLKHRFQRYQREGWREIQLLCFLPYPFCYQQSDITLHQAAFSIRTAYRSRRASGLGQRPEGAGRGKHRGGCKELAEM